MSIVPTSDACELLTPWAEMERVGGFQITVKLCNDDFNKFDFKKV